MNMCCKIHLVSTSSKNNGSPTCLFRVDPYNLFCSRWVTHSTNYKS